MLTAEDLIHLPYTADLTPAGIAYACRSLPHQFDRPVGASLEQLQRVTAGKAAELAFRRYLDAQAVPYDTLGASLFTEPDRYDVTLGGRRCEIKSYLVNQREKIQLIRSQPEIVLQDAALAPAGQLQQDRQADTDLWIFAFVAGQTATRPVDITQGRKNQIPLFLVHLMPEAWSYPQKWVSLEPITFHSECSQPIQLELGGQNKSRGYITESVTIPPLGAVCAQQDFFALTYLHASTLPPGKISLHCLSLDPALLLIDGSGWGNIWVDGQEILLTGYITRAEFRRQAQTLPAASRRFRQPRSRLGDLALPISALHPLASLFEQTRAWARRSTHP